MMKESEFINAVQFKPWKNRADTLDSMDCYGLIKLYFEHVEGKTIPAAEGYKEGHRFDSVWRREIDKTWRQVGCFTVGAMVTFYTADMKPAHVGICISGNKVLHSRGNVEDGGKVEIHKIATLQAAYKMSTFHKLVV
ncbi:hypothetical protein [Pseudoalteromonas phage C7]|uniref:minor tail protein n=1 Tax=Pseudoalteromonas phage C7 TaxID=2510494 RepID=UPI0010198B70|nr:minor tail protein [Pseudoalteromonas phage C7]QAY17956.1 hypothetical protein [Pseudoalteromonas phage C7]